MPLPFQSRLPSGLQCQLMAMPYFSPILSSRYLARPYLIAGFFGAFGEDLELPLTGGDFRVDAFDIKACIQAGIEVFFYHIAPIGVTGTNGAIIRTLRAWKAAFGEADWFFRFGIPQKVFLFEAEPEVVVVIIDERAAVAGVGGPIGAQYFAH